MKAFELKPEWFEALQAVADSGSVREAAAALYLTEQSLRYQLKALEKHVQKPLFIQAKTGLQLNPEVAGLLSLGRDFGQRLARVQHRLQTLAGSQQRLRIGATTAYPLGDLTDLFANLRAGFPSLQLTLGLHNPRELERRLSQGDLELGLMTWEPDNPHLIGARGPVWPGLFVKAADRQVPERFFLPPAWRFFHHKPVNYPQELAHYATHYIGGMSQIHALVLAGAGIGYLPRSQVRADLAAGRLQPCAGPPLSFSVSEFLLARDLDKLSEPAAQFVAGLRAHWQALERQGIAAPAKR